MPGGDLGLYRLVAPIGQGAVGTVFSGEYGALRRPVAIKLLHAHLVRDGSVKRMLEEARTISLLDHPGIVKVFDVGLTNDGRAFVVMECLVGEPLSARLRRTRLPEDQVILFARQLASALDVAHQAGVIHRDLKPENIFLVADPDIPGGERVKVLDFGIAKRDGKHVTATGIVLGTPAYMAPEQCRGSRDIDARADIYSLGVVLYVMATRTQPFQGRDTDEILAEHEYCAHAPPEGVSAGLAAIIDRCMAKRPDDRFATMAALGAALRELVEPADGPDSLLGETVLALSGDVSERLSFQLDTEDRVRGYIAEDRARERGRKVHSLFDLVESAHEQSVVAARPDTLDVVDAGADASFGFVDPDREPSEPFGDSVLEHQQTNVFAEIDVASQLFVVRKPARRHPNGTLPGVVDDVPTPVALPVLPPLVTRAPTVRPGVPGPALLPVPPFPRASSPALIARGTPMGAQRPSVVARASTASILPGPPVPRRPTRSEIATAVQPVPRPRRTGIIIAIAVLGLATALVYGRLAFDLEVAGWVQAVPMLPFDA